MAAARRRPKPKGKKSDTIPKTAAEKQAGAALYASQQVQVEATRQRSRAGSRGFIGGRQLRASGTDLQRYNMAKFTSDPFPALTGGNNPPGGNGGDGTRKPKAPSSGGKGPKHGTGHSGSTTRGPSGPKDAGKGKGTAKDGALDIIKSGKAGITKKPKPKKKPKNDTGQGTPRSTGASKGPVIS